MAIQGAASELAASQQRLEAQWHSVQATWRDLGCERFEQACMVPLGHVVPNHLPAMENLQRALDEALRTCP